MGTDTKAKLTSNPKIENVVEFMKSVKEFSNVKLLTYKEKSVFKYTDDDNVTKDIDIEASGWIGFQFTNKNNEIEERQFFFLEDTYDKSKESSIAPFSPDHYTHLSLGMWGGSVDIMNIIATEFGGFVIPNDCADETSDDFFQIINGAKNFVLPTTTLNLFEALSDMNSEDKLNFIKILEANKEVISNFLSA